MSCNGDRVTNRAQSNELSTVDTSCSPELGSDASEDTATLLFEAAREGLLEVVEYAVDSRVALDATNPQGESALKVAARHGHWDIVHFLTCQGTEAQQKATLFWLSAEYGNADMLQYLLDGKVAVDQTNASSATALIVAAQHGHAEVVAVLLAAKADVRLTDREGRDALFWASQNGRAEVVELLEGGPKPSPERRLYAAAEAGDVAAVESLLQTKAGLDHPAEGGGTPLYVACANGHVEVARLLVEAGAALAHAAADGHTPLYAACQRGHLAVARLLISARAEVDQPTEDGCTPLWVASLNGHVEVARLLVGAGAAPNRVGDAGRPPLWMACQNGHVAVARLLLSVQAEVDRAADMGWTPLLITCQNGHAETARLLLGAGAEVNHAEEGGCTPLYAACQSGHGEVARLLLSARAAVNQTEEDGCTPLYIASQNGHVEVAGLLLEARAAVNRGDANRRGPLFMASYGGHTEVARLLVSAKAEVDQPTQEDCTPLWAASFRGHVEVARLLFQAKADVNRPAEDGTTPLLMAAYEGHCLVTQWLLSVGADHRRADKESRSPLWVSVQYQHADCLGALLQARADANSHHPHTGQTALMCAAATGNTAAIQLLQANGARDDLRDTAGFTTYYHADCDVEKAFAPPRLEELLQASGNPAVDTAELSEVLRDPRVEVNAGDKYLHWTALMEAVLFGRAEAVACLLSHAAAPAVPMFCGLTAAFWACLRGDPAICAALGAGVEVTAKEKAGLMAIYHVRRRSEEANELLAFEQGGAAGVRGERRGRRNAALGVQDRWMADVRSEVTAGRFYPEGYQCNVSLYQFFTTSTEFHKQLLRQERLTPAEEEEMLALGQMVAEGRKVAAIHVAAPAPGLRPEEAACPPEDVFALFCYTYESAAYKRSNWAMRCWRQLDAQAALQDWRPFIFHCERALRRLPRRSVTVYRGIPVPFEANDYGEGHEFTWPSFSSTSESLKVAKNFAASQSKALIFIIKSFSGVSISHCSRYPAEAEVLLPPNCCLRTRWLGRQSVLAQTNLLLNLPQMVGSADGRCGLRPYELTEEEAALERVVVVYCQQEETFLP